VGKLQNARPETSFPTGTGDTTKQEKIKFQKEVNLEIISWRGYGLKKIKIHQEVERTHFKCPFRGGKRKLKGGKFFKVP